MLPCGKSSRMEITKPVATAKKVAEAAAPVNSTTKPSETHFDESILLDHLAEAAGVEIKAAGSAIASLEAAMLASVHKKWQARSRCQVF